MSSTKTNIERAADHIGASRATADQWVYYADEVSDWYVVSEICLAGLVDYLDHEDEQVRDSAYSHWCAGDSSGEPLDIGHKADYLDAIGAAWALEGIDAGTRVCGGEPGTEDYDEGIVHEIDGNRALVGWGTGVSTWTPVEMLRPRSDWS